MTKLTRIESRNLQQLPNPVMFWLDEYQYYITNYDFLYLSTARSSRASFVANQLANMITIIFSFQLKNIEPMLRN